jgi:hypothetical protein
MKKHIFYLLILCCFTACSPDKKSAETVQEKEILSFKEKREKEFLRLLDSAGLLKTGTNNFLCINLSGCAGCVNNALRYTGFVFEEESAYRILITGWSPAKQRQFAKQLTEWDAHPAVIPDTLNTFFFPGLLGGYPNVIQLEKSESKPLMRFRKSFDATKTDSLHFVLTALNFSHSG